MSNREIYGRFGRSMVSEPQNKWEKKFINCLDFDLGFPPEACPWSLRSVIQITCESFFLLYSSDSPPPTIFPPMFPHRQHNTWVVLGLQRYAQWDKKRSLKIYIFLDWASLCFRIQWKSQPDSIKLVFNKVNNMYWLITILDPIETCTTYRRQKIWPG